MLKNAKYLISALTAMSLLMSAAPMTSNAIIRYNYGDVKYEGYAELEDVHVFYSPHPDTAKFYIDSTGTKAIATYPVDDIVRVELAEGVSESDIKECLQDIRAENGLEFRVNYEFSCYDISCYSSTYKDGITANDARMLCKVLKEKELISDFTFMYDRVYESRWYGTYLTGYQERDGEREKIEEYISNNDTGLKIADKFGDVPMLGDYIQYDEERDYPLSLFYVYPENGFESLEHQLEVAEMIYENIGIRPYYISPTSSSNGADEIDVLGSIPGDADCDGIVKMNDAVLIMQTISNPDKYSLTPQGRFNGDTANPGDGITPLDAAAVQNMLLGLPY